ncbi:histone-lysine N-methyltransferase, H3 lysine-9 specific SUVH6 [Cajanus cajan]|uniref:histone-lysine N-methyltransferase, H3 lysine-9 specific SUVH6 n=1 Tax=Cajanus cajan TaxID=3821 RepID=UPI00098D8B80|nr:histone-lysine N-methyltransferase, H3 lysine-9 specific SUVH6 [Cajanus cajan]XP_020216311.1 histone-lysine N-methyltransferase, H3 lysine-9 specific SUVH6 [Cajanus cajan]XP_020216313.1 histone-lysine N-methyltransferase, H3 lysine-9 specific SUVH6 [Cajanus cajan]
MTTPVNNGHSEKSYEKSAMENGEHVFLPRPMYKRRKVSAIRDFPDGCGPFALRIDPVLNVNNVGCGSLNGIIAEDKNGEHLGGDILETSECENNGQHSELKDSHLIETLGQKIDCGLNKENHAVSSYQVDGPTAENEPAKVSLGQTTDYGLNNENPVISSHKVDGPTVEDEAAKVTIGQTFDSSLNQETPVVSSHHLDGSIAEDEPAKVMLGQKTDSGLNQENPVVSCHQVDEPTAEDGHVKVPLVDVEILNTESAITVNTVKCDSSYMLKSYSPGELAMLSGSEPLSFNVNISGSHACMVEPVTRRYLPRRKVSAVRNFPLSCGRNVTCLSKNVCLEGIPSENKKVGQQSLAVDDSPLKKVAATDAKEVKDNIQDEYGCKRKLVDIVQTDSERNAVERVKKLHVFESSSEMKMLPENKRQKYVTLPEKSNHRQVKINSKVVGEEENRDGVPVDKTSGLEIFVHPVQSLKTKPLNMSRSKQKLKENFNRLQVSSDRKVVLGLMAKSECPWSSDKGSSKFKLVGGKNEGKRKKVVSFASSDSSKTAIKTKGAPNHSGQKPLKKKKGNAASGGMDELLIWEKEDCLDHAKNNEDLQIVLKSDFDVNVTPYTHSNSTGDENDANVTRKKVRETLQLFQVVSRKLLREVESKLNERANGKRIDLHAARILKENGKYVNLGKQILGSVPGVEVGDEFQYRVELNIVGLHRQIQGGIDYVKHDGKILATSIVASGGYADDLDNSDVLIYTGQGGNVMNNDKEPEDQKLERGNLALKNSSKEKNPVRVIRGTESMDGKCKTYVYDGLYEVESCWQDVGPHGKLVFKFRLRRIPGQPELALKEVKKSKKFKTREGVCVDDISYGKERIPICAVNTIDDEKPPQFNYITSMIYPNCRLDDPEGCDCTNGCSDLGKCSCGVKNGGEIPFNHNEAIVQAKPLVYECGPTCKCPSTCHNRVSQLGIKFQLEIFKTSTRGWGVRSLNSIPSGSFICEYIGELLEDKEAEQRTGNDEYLFDIGNNFGNNTLLDELLTVMPDAQTSSCEVVKDGGFTIDAAQFGNVGRFINHSCSPNLYAQNVLYDHHDNRMPHIMFFAAENIPPLQELTYDYNYAIDQVRDSDGNVKKKYCYCGSVECTGRMY